MPNLISAQLPKRFKLLQNSESGTGKTTRSLSATQFGKVYVFDTDEKLVLTAEELDPEVKKLVDYDVYVDELKMNMISKKLEVSSYGFNKVMAKIQELKKDCPYNTIVLDTWSRMFDMMDSKFCGGKVKKDFDDWGLLLREQLEFLNNLFAINANIIINAHIGSKENKVGRDVLTVGTPGQFGTKMPEFFNETHYLFYDTLSKKYKAQGKYPANVVCNSALPLDLFDDKGCFLKSDLSIFEKIAKKD